MNQNTLGLEPLHKKTRKEVFLEQTNKSVPSQALVALIQPDGLPNGISRP